MVMSILLIRFQVIEHLCNYVFIVESSHAIIECQLFFVGIFYCCIFHNCMLSSILEDCR
jgi:hypothetical protein